MRKRNNRNSGTQLDTTAWMVTFGDLLMLLLTFFVLLLSMSSMDVKVLKNMFSVFGAARGPMEFSELERMEGLPDHMFKDSIGGTMELSDAQKLKVMRDRIDMILAKKKGIQVTSRKMVEEFFALGDEVDDEMLEALETIMDISEDERGVMITFRESVLFNPEEAEIKPTMFPILDSIAKILDAVSNEVLIMGHTDNVPIHNERYGSNWELSLYRALNVHRYFVEEKSLSPERFTVGGYGDLRPRFPNNTREGRERNRRVEIILKKRKTEGDNLPTLTDG